MALKVSTIKLRHDVNEIFIKTSNNLWKRILSALFYALASIMITLINKNILTVHAFPSVICLGLGQIITTIVLLYCAKKCKFIDFPDMSYKIYSKIMPMPLIYMGNMIFGLGGTKELSLPMFTALRRFLILMTMAAEYYLLQLKPTFGIQLGVYIMIIGAIIAAYDDLGFSIIGYACIFSNNFFSAANGVYIKKKLDSRDKMGKYGLMYYNSLFILVPTLTIAQFTGDLEMAWNYAFWNDGLFVLQFLTSCVMGFVLTYSVFLCTNYNSALGTSIIGCFKNICITYVGMVFGQDYMFSWLNFIGINISVAGSLMYLLCSRTKQ